MTINEISKELNITKRAIKFYEEKGLINVKKEINGYRNYSDSNMEKLRKISLYRKLGISIADIKKILEKDDKTVLLTILENKENELKLKIKEYEELKAFVSNEETKKIYEHIEYETIGKAIKDAIPGFYGYYFLNHFTPYLQGTIETPEQKEAYKNICDFWDNTDIKIPLLMKLSGWPLYIFGKEMSAEAMAYKIDAEMKLYLEPNAEQYEKLKKNILNGYRIKRLMRFHPVYISQRKFMKELQNKGYNDIFIPNMRILSPGYQKYHDALDAVNKQICSELGLYYDTNYNLLRKNSVKQ